ncbi:gamma-glutamyltransferase [Nitratireductor mangrovi]|uniref:Glutathione hydrolase proenzyme n=1 Tax=Nitratireductor mangrovi TaxID=2599600 RepID=A0A5B8L506_9HYPH|nr:gamma-glutamyltransferase [Nitratireductor mangrovi]QDZ02852.1 gamma-glutamyltransferase [Nitratireductor mangrovi]
MTRSIIAALFGTTLLLGAPSAAQQATDAVAPEAATGITERQAVLARTRMVAAANPIAAEAGLAVLRNGGSAADALVVVQTVLGLVEPQSSGIGGGAFLVWYDAESGKITTFDGRETAPSAATPELFLDGDGAPLKFFDAVMGGRSVGVPGVVRLMEKVHARFGDKPWAELFEPAATLAETGFAVSPRLEAMIVYDAARLSSQPATRAYFFHADGTPLKAGETLTNPAYAKSLRAIAQGGADAFYEEGLAEAIVTAVNGHPDNPGALSMADMAAYEARERDAVCVGYRGNDICGMGPPSSGALAVGQTLGMLEGFDLAALGPDDPEAWRLIGDASRLAFADRGLYVADSDFVRLPAGLLDRDYLASRGELLRRPTALGEDEVRPGEPPWDKAEHRIEGLNLEMPSTTHFVIVDDRGNIASMTSSIENAFGARLMVAGFLLNNQLTDFSFRPEADGAAVANRVEPGKRPRSSMSPTIVLRDGRPVYALGSPGGSNIIPYVTKTLIGLIDWRMDMQQAISLPHLTNRFGTYQLEAGTKAERLADDLTALGFEVEVSDLNSGLHGVALRADGTLEGGADPRREGMAVGD